MSRFLSLALALTALASCGAAKDKAMNETATRFALASSDIRDGQSIPQAFTCDGSNQSPALNWDEPPPGTKSLAVVMDDPDAPSGTFRHWGAYDIPANARSIPTGSAIGKQAANGFGNHVLSSAGGAHDPRADHTSAGTPTCASRARGRRDSRGLSGDPVPDGRHVLSTARTDGTPLR